MNDGISEPFLAEIEDHLHTKLPYCSLEWEYGRRLVAECRRLQQRERDLETAIQLDEEIIIALHEEVKRTHQYLMEDSK